MTNRSKTRRDLDGRHADGPQTISAWLITTMREAILRGELPAGERLRQNAIADRYGVSTTPVREAFTALGSEGLLVTVPHKGVVVYRPTVRELEEIYTIRLALEPVATTAAVPKLSKGDLETLRDILEDMESLSPDDHVGVHDLNARFHACIYAAAEFPRLESMIAQLREASAVYLRLYQLVRDRSDTEREHRAIYAACAARRPRRAADEMARHLRHTLDIVKRELQMPAEDGVPVDERRTLLDRHAHTGVSNGVESPPVP